ncbi:DUF488 family protein [Priestia megaterium]
MALKVYTSQYSYRGEDRLDTTVKTSDGLFAPTWDIVMGIKNKKITEEEYRKKYLNLLRQSYISKKDQWKKLLNKKSVTFVCFCKKGDFCHRLILAEVFQRLGADYVGEVDSKGSLIKVEEN